MPRPKKIENDNTISKLMEQAIVDNDCLSAEVYISGLDEKMLYLIENFYKCTVTEGRFIIKTTNSWKGLIHFLLSILYCKIGGKIAAVQAIYGFSRYIKVGNDFESLELLDKQASPFNDVEPLKLMHIEKYGLIEPLLIPKTYRPIYVRSHYKNENILKALREICNALEIDVNKSTLNVISSKDKIKNYISKPIKKEKDVQNLICILDGYYDEKITPTKENNTLSLIKKIGVKINNPLGEVKKMERFNTGVAFVQGDTMKSLLNKYSIIVAHPSKTLQQMKKFNEDKLSRNHPYKFLAYPILKRYEEQLIEYFPLCKDSIKKYALKTDKFEDVISMGNSFLELGCYYIITDFIEIGKWG